MQTIGQDVLHRFAEGTVLHQPLQGRQELHVTQPLHFLAHCRLLRR
jgi:hypothetical protein